MYSIPEDFDITVWTDAKLWQVSFSANTIDLHFENAPGIQSEGPFALSTERKQFYYEVIFPVQDDMGLLKLLEQRVTLVSTDPERRNLSLEFESGYTLELISLEEYESYIIYTDASRLVM
jgi:hypothetical protein